MTRIKFISTIFVALSSFFVTVANAQETLEEIVVTADLLNRSAMDLATSVTVIDNTAIKNRGALQLEQLLNLAPNVNYSSGASRGRFIQIRGIGERSEFTAPSNPSVGVLLDGIDLTGISTAVSTLDIAQVEILRGPQGTIHGANALAGLIKIPSAAPTDIYEGNVSAEIGNYGQRSITGTFNAPITDNLGLRVSALKNKSNGFIQNTFLERDDTNDIDEETLKAKLAWQASESLSFDLTALHADVDNGYDAFSLDNTRETLSDEPGQDRQETNAFSLETIWEANDVIALESLVSYARSDTEYGYDEDWSFSDICAGTDCEGWEYSSTDNYFRENDNLSADFRVRSRDTGSKAGWVAGVYYRDQNRDLLRIYTFDDDFSSTFDTENIALYGELSFAITDRLSLSGGLRAEQYEASYSDSNEFSDTGDEDLWGGKVSLEYDTSASTRAYLLVSRGYKVGGFNANPALSEDQRLYDTEFMWNYEAGFKGSWADGMLVSNLSVFYQDRKDVQANLSRQETIGGEFVIFLGNAAKGTNAGVEAETKWYVYDKLELFLTLGLLDTQFDDFFNPSHVDGSPENPVDLSGRDQSHAPNYMFNIGADWEILEVLSARIDIEGKDAFYFSDSHDVKSESYALLNARLSYAVDDFEVSLWGRNLTDEDVEVRGFFFSNDGGNDPRKFYAPEPYTQLGEPRVFGISSTYNF